MTRSYQTDPVFNSPNIFILILEAPIGAFFQNTLKTLFRLSRALLDISKCILSGATKFLSVLSS